ncbi:MULTISPECIES: DUF6479 family protein [Streptomyces]|uniref:Secreted protein n=1 Tax=Streptomyces amritsarensis TaxID=681158 RepID=A0ABX3GB31_9ACTN|nr:MULTISPECIES: DUF6479 family protein [Streptomyces]AQT74419.1 hypothetical protein B1K54_24670 [Streptomyces sp. fd1-xmd]MDX6764363.1 DUF6479 family protein [Streptomyces sp. F8]OLZ74042.1 hypothetical protein AVW11_00825 [Streptomyces amritsarensis]
MDMILSVDPVALDIVWFLVVGIVVAGMLLGGFKLGQRVRAKEPPPPAPEEQPHLPNGGAVYEVREERDQVEIPEGGLRPHEMQGYGNFGSTTSSHPDEVRKERESGYRLPEGPGPHPQPGAPPDAGRGAHS